MSEEKKEEKHIEWKARTGKRESAGSRSVALANSLDNDSNSNDERDDASEDDKNTSD